MTTYLVLLLVNVLLSGAWVWGTAKWTDLRFPVADLLITVVLCSVLALLPGYGWMLAMVVLWLILKGVERADLWPHIIVLAGGSAFIWLTTYMTALSMTS